MKSILFILSLLYSLSCFSQAPGIKIWDYRYGGSNDESPHAFERTLDNGFIIGGSSESSISFDKSDTSRGISDYWVVRTDSIGNILWDKTYGGTDLDFMNAILVLPDSGFLLGGLSKSDISGEKTDSSRGMMDFWIIRIDKNGTVLWDKTFGGNKDDRFWEMLLMPDGNILLGGMTSSDSTGDMSHHSYGFFDYWLIKIDLNGNKIWDKNYGGSSYDDFSCLSMTNDNGYILGGVSRSPVSGCKSQPPINTLYDYWIIKVDSNGVQQWDKTYGGDEMDFLKVILVQPNDNLYLCGFSFSGLGHDKSIANHGDTLSDLWIIKTDDSGYKLWDKVYGGDNDEEDLNSALFFYGGIFITGASYSNISGDKKENNVLDTEQSWAIAINLNGHLMWDKTLHTPAHIERCKGFQLDENCFVFMTYTGADGGDVSQVRNSGVDYWLAKFCISGLTGDENINDNKSINDFIVSYSSEEIYIEIISALAKTSFIEITDHLGKKIYYDDISLQSGKNGFRLKGLNITTGIYFVRSGAGMKRIVLK
jgi:hypothetical protein